jgi:uncharacterized protein YdeI (YjbR/CyaY-like superfamily)
MAAGASAKPRFFATPEALRAWFAEHADSAQELLIGFWKRDSGKPSVTWPQSVDEALCVGWIDGIRRARDAQSYTIRFTPRRPTSVWSAINIARVDALAKQGRMRPAGLAAFAKRRENRSGIYAYEQREAKLPEPYASMLRERPRAAEFFASLTPGVRKKLAWWVVAAKREATRRTRLDRLVAAAERGELPA